MTRIALKAGVFLLCCVADAFVLRTTWTGLQVATGQFRRGYFERAADGGSGIVIDEHIRPVFPGFLVGERGNLAIPPGMTAILPLDGERHYRLSSQTGLAPYIVVGTEVPLDTSARSRPGALAASRLTRPLTLQLTGEGLVLVEWDSEQPWARDAERLGSLLQRCQGSNATNPGLSVQTSSGTLEVGLGSCRIRTDLLRDMPNAQLAVLAGPVWTVVDRQPGWQTERWIVWPILAAVVVKVAALWWALGAISSVVSSGALLVAAWPLPVPAVLTWPLLAVVGAMAAVGRALLAGVRRLPAPRRVPMAIGLFLFTAWAIAVILTDPGRPPPIWRDAPATDAAEACTVLGYSTVGDASLRNAHGGIRWILNERCEGCKHRTASLAAGGETLAWVRDAFCASSPMFAAQGQVVFLGGANDDFAWGLLTAARLFIVGTPSPETWEAQQLPAAAASARRIDAQTAALRELLQCVRRRGSDFLFLHDALVNDLKGGRPAERAAMLAQRRRVVEEEGGRFIDLLDHFGEEIGVTWFNDYVHPSQIFHERIATLACATPLRP